MSDLCKEFPELGVCRISDLSTVVTRNSSLVPLLSTNTKQKEHKSYLSSKRLIELLVWQTDLGFMKVN